MFRGMAGLRESILERLERARLHWRTVARFANVPYHTLVEIAHNDKRSPRIDTLEKINAGLKEYERLVRQVKRDWKEAIDREHFERLQKRVLAAEARASKNRSRDETQAAP